MDVGFDKLMGYVHPLKALPKCNSRVEKLVLWRVWFLLSFVAHLPRASVFHLLLIYYLIAHTAFSSFKTALFLASDCRFCELTGNMSWANSSPGMAISRAPPNSSPEINGNIDHLRSQSDRRKLVVVGLGMVGIAFM